MPSWTRSFNTPPRSLRARATSFEESKVDNFKERISTLKETALSALSPVKPDATQLKTPKSSTTRTPLRNVSNDAQSPYVAGKVQPPPQKEASAVDANPDSKPDKFDDLWEHFESTESSEAAHEGVPERTDSDVATPESAFSAGIDTEAEVEAVWVYWEDDMIETYTPPAVGATLLLALLMAVAALSAWLFFPTTTVAPAADAVVAGASAPIGLGAAALIAGTRAKGMLSAAMAYSAAATTHHASVALRYTSKAFDQTRAFRKAIGPDVHRLAAGIFHAEALHRGFGSAPFEGFPPRFLLDFA